MINLFPKSAFNRYVEAQDKEIASYFPGLAGGILPENDVSAVRKWFNPTPTGWLDFFVVPENVHRPRSHRHHCCIYNENDFWIDSDSQSPYSERNEVVKRKMIQMILACQESAFEFWLIDFEMVGVGMKKRSFYLLDP